MTPAEPAPRSGWRARLDSPLVRFALIALALYGVWFAVYEAWLGPDGRLDLFVAEVVAQASAGFLGLLGYAPWVISDKVWVTPTAGAWVTTGCNGVSTIALFAGFVLAYPGTWRRRALFLPLGALFVFVVNVLRVALIVVILDRAPAQFEWVHALGAPHVFYAMVFVLWVLWVRYGGGPAPDREDAPASVVSPQPA